MPQIVRKQQGRQIGTHLRKIGLIHIVHSMFLIDLHYAALRRQFNFCFRSQHNSASAVHSFTHFTI